MQRDERPSARKTRTLPEYAAAAAIVAQIDGLHEQIKQLQQELNTDAGRVALADRAAHSERCCCADCS